MKLKLTKESMKEALKQNKKTIIGYYAYTTCISAILVLAMAIIKQAIEKGD